VTAHKQIQAAVQRPIVFCGGTSAGRAAASPPTPAYSLGLGSAGQAADWSGMARSSEAANIRCTRVEFRSFPHYEQMMSVHAWVRRLILLFAGQRDMLLDESLITRQSAPGESS
jgi:hypothetical protein